MYLIFSSSSLLLLLSIKFEIEEEEEEEEEQKYIWGRMGREVPGQRRGRDSKRTQEAKKAYATPRND